MDLEEEKAEIEAHLATPEGAQDMSLFAKHTEISKQLSQAEDEWAEAVEEQEKLTN